MHITFPKTSKKSASKVEILLSGAKTGFGYWAADRNEK